jgi:hypothetical protein
MTEEELNVIKNLTNEIKEFRKCVKTLSLLKYAEIKAMNSNLKQTETLIKKHMEEGNTFIETIRQE